jgi:putative phosphoribosyl transferase
VRETCERLRRFADEVVCLIAPEPFQAVGLWYEEFTQTTDDEAKRLLTPAERAEPAISLLHRNADEA